MATTFWDEVRGLKTTENDWWEIFHEASKLGRYDEFPSQESIVARMKELLESLPYDPYPEVALPTEMTALDMRLSEAVLSRTSCRAMRPRSIELRDLAALLHHAYGITRDNSGTEYTRGFRAAPSGGGLYPLEIYFHTKHVQGLRPGLYHYNPLQRNVRLLRGEDLTPRIAEALVPFQSTIAADASVIFFLTALFERSTFKYGLRGYRFILLEAGHVAQTLNLAANALGLGSLNIGGYYDRQIDELLGLDGLTQSTLYMVAAGERVEGTEADQDHHHA
ncbi:MAG: SagB/ThcOx family dehydrogenase [Acidobacteria bacterium]|nr:SagB/ThcOx family dehydrogenase [Acidobacteriota bacterium]